MIAYCYEDLKEMPLFNNSYKVHIKGVIEINRNEYMYMMYTHGKIYGFLPDYNVEKLNVFNQDEIKKLIDDKKIRSYYKYEKELIINKDAETFTSNIFSIEESGMYPFIDQIFVVNDEIEKMVIKGIQSDRNEFFKKYFNISISQTLDDIINDSTKNYKDILKDTDLIPTRKIYR